MSEESQLAPAAEGSSASSKSSPLPADAAEKLAALWLELLQDVRASSLKHSEHADAMLTWAIGLMGAGVFYANNLLSSAPSGLRLVALAPWILGILVSLAARVIGGRLLQTDAGWYFEQVVSFKGQVLLATGIVATLVALIGSLVSIVMEAREAYSGPSLWWLRLSLAAHVLAGTGILTVVAASFFPAGAAAAVVVLVLCLALVVFLRATVVMRKAYVRSLDDAAKALKSMLSRVTS